MRGLFGSDWNWIVAGVVAAWLIPALSFLGGMPFWIAAVVGGVVFAGLVLVLAPRRLFDGVNVQALGRGSVAFANDLLREAMPAAERLRIAAKGINDKDVAGKVRHLAEISADVFAKIEASPQRAATVRRFLSYYIPRAAEVAEGYAAIETKRAPDLVKLAEVRSVIGKLEEAFVHYSDSLVDDDLGALDTDIRLIQASLKEDLGR
jgi:5-bromo-4-chloroindolyl phosphate hydrolysis protein